VVRCRGSPPPVIPSKPGNACGGLFERAIRSWCSGHLDPLSRSGAGTGILPPEVRDRTRVGNDTRACFAECARIYVRMTMILGQRLCHEAGSSGQLTGMKTNCRVRWLVPRRTGAPWCALRLLPGRSDGRVRAAGGIPIRGANQLESWRPAGDHLLDAPAVTIAADHRAWCRACIVSPWLASEPRRNSRIPGVSSGARLDSGG